MNIKRISSTVLASIILMTSNMSFANEINTDNNIAENNTSEIEDNKQSRNSYPEITFGKNMEISLSGYSGSYNAIFTTTSKGIITFDVAIPDVLINSSNSLFIQIYDLNNNKEVTYDYLSGKEFNGNSNITYRIGLEPGQYKVNMYITDFLSEKQKTNMKVSFSKNNNIEMEPNNFTDSAQLINLNRTYTGSGHNYDDDYFMLKLDKDTKVNITVKENNTINKYRNLKISARSSNGNYSYTSQRFHKNTLSYDITLTKGLNKIIVDSYSGLTDYKIKVSEIDGPLMPYVDNIPDDKTKVTGTTEAGTKVYIKVGSGNYKRANVDSRGDFSLTTGKIKEGTVVSVFAKDSNGKNSNIAYVTSYDNTPPSAPKVNKITVKNELISGTTEANATVECSVKRNGKYSYYDTKANSKGNFEIIVDSLKKGDEVSVYATDSNDNRSKGTKIIVQNYVKAPKVTALSNISTTISGTATKGNTVYAKIGKKYYKATVNSNGKFSIKIPKQEYKTVIKLYAKDKNGDTSTVVSTTVGYAPKKPSIANVTTKSTVVTGYTTKNAIVAVQVGNKTYSTTANAKGKYTVKIPKQKKGTKITVKAKIKKTGFKSYTSSTTVK